MPRVIIVALLVVLTIGSLAAGGDRFDTAAQEENANHPFVGTWIVDTISASEHDSPEIAIVTADGGVVGQGANRSAGGHWEAIDDRSVELTLVSVSEQDGVGGYIVVRGPHTVDETGDAWTCDCTFTIVGADGAVRDSGSAPASGTRLPLQGMDLVGSPLPEVPIWTPVISESTPAA
jgi:hypothetical protein